MTKQAFVADEQLGVIARRVHELIKRVLSGSLDPARVAAGLQQIIEDKMPNDGIVVSPARKHWVSIKDAREFGETIGYSRHAVGQMYRNLMRGVTSRPVYGLPVPSHTPGWPIEHRGSEYGEPPNMEFERRSLVKFLSSNEFATTESGWGKLTRAVVFAWLDHLGQMQFEEGLPIEELFLGTSEYTCLKRAGITTVGQLLERSESDLNAMPNFGLRSIHRIVQVLDGRGLRLRQG